MSKRKYRYPTLLVARYLTIARAMGLSCPLGRAVYAANRVYNGARWPNMQDMRRLDGDVAAGLRTHEDLIPHLRTIRASTAKRWEKHWKAGGAVKALKYSHEEWLALRRANEFRRDGTRGRDHVSN